MKSSKYLLVVILLLGTFVEGFAQAAQATAIVPPQVFFTDPDRLEEGKKDKSLINQIDALVKATPPGEEITVCVFKFEVEELAESFLAAQERGVKVRMILNNGETSDEANEDLKELFEEKLEDFHYIENDISKKSIIHNKFILFSKVESTQGPLDHVILQTSSNFQKKGTKKLQDMVILSNSEIYFSYLDFWYDIKVLGNVGQLDEFEYFETSSPDKNYQAYFFPKRRSGEAFGDDIILEILEEIRDPDQAEIRIAHGKWEKNRKDILQELQELQEDGALVEVVVNKDLQAEIKDGLKDLEKGVVRLDDSYNLHTKFFLINNNGKKRVWTGSHNLTKRSLRKNFEVLLMIEDPQIYQAYLNYFQEIKDLKD